MYSFSYLATAIILRNCAAKPHVSGDTQACLAILGGYIHAT